MRVESFVCRFELLVSGNGVDELGINIIIFRNEAIEMELIVHKDGAINRDESINLGGW